jgi:hypothetical protein
MSIVGFIIYMVGFGTLARGTYLVVKNRKGKKED